jgi:hypothetical protein
MVTYRYIVFLLLFCASEYFRNSFLNVGHSVYPVNLPEMQVGSVQYVQFIALRPN